jgi:hypothetical protein
MFAKAVFITCFSKRVVFETCFHESPPIYLRLSDLYKGFLNPQQTFIEMATAVFTEALENPQQLTRLILENRSYAVNIRVP